jgi:hypothetical protein
MNITKILRILAFLIMFASCTDLEEVFLDEELSDVTASSESVLAAAYNRMIKDVFVDQAHLWGMQEYSTDEAMLPTRGSDWGDGGKYRAIHEFTWGPDASLVSSNWSALTNGITRSLTAIETVQENAQESNYEMYLAESKALLSLYTYYTLDLYGQSPMRNPGGTENIYAIESSYIDTLITNVESIVPNLAAMGENSTYNGRFTKEAAYAFLAEMYMNRAVFMDRYNESSDFNFTEASVNNPAKNDMDMVIEYTTKLISSPAFSLEVDYFHNFDIDNGDGTELIFVAPQNVNDNAVTGQNDMAYMPMERAQHVTEEGVRGTNASCTTPDYYATWNDNQDDPRFMQKYQYSDGTWFYNNKEQNILESTLDVVENTEDNLPWFHFNRGFLVGQQYGPTYDSEKKFVRETIDGEVYIVVSALETDKNDSMMVFTPHLDFSSGSILPQDKVHQGVRIFKFEFDPINGSNGTSRYDIPIFRLGYIYTLRAEAYFRNGNSADALADINELRTSRMRTQPEDEGGNLWGVAISNLDEETLYSEISYENYWEGKRRPQMIRFGTFDKAYAAKEASEPYRRLYPIPQDVIDVSGDIFKQNKGYN